MPAKKSTKKTVVTFSDGREVKFPAYTPVGRTRAQTTKLMEEKGMHPAMIRQATRFMKK